MYIEECRVKHFAKLDYFLKKVKMVIKTDLFLCVKLHWQRRGILWMCKQKKWKYFVTSAQAILEKSAVAYKHSFIILLGATNITNKHTAIQGYTIQITEMCMKILHISYKDHPIKKKCETKSDNWALWRPTSQVQRYWHKDPPVLPTHSCTEDHKTLEQYRTTQTKGNNG